MTHESRRSFLSKLAAGSALAAGAPSILSASESRAAHPLRRAQKRTANDQIQIAIIGAGGMGKIDVNTALDIEGIKLVAACDLYQGRLESAKEAWTKQGKEGEEVEVDLFPFLSVLSVLSVAICPPEYIWLFRYW